MASSLCISFCPVELSSELRVGRIDAGTAPLANRFAIHRTSDVRSSELCSRTATGVGRELQRRALSSEPRKEGISRRSGRIAFIFRPGSRRVIALRRQGLVSNDAMPRSAPRAQRSSREASDRSALLGHAGPSCQRSRSWPDQRQSSHHDRRRAALARCRLRTKGATHAPYLETRLTAKGRGRPVVPLRASLLSARARSLL